MRGQMYKVFYNKSVICIAEKSTNVESDFRLVQLANQMETFQFIGDYLKLNTKADVWLIGYNAKDMFEDVQSCFHFIEAAGGLVKNNEQTYLFIRRFGIWDLPKGKMKKNEKPEVAAKREVSEETGVFELSVIEELLPTFHIYLHKDQFIMKKTYWFAMKTSCLGTLIPQQEEDITEAVWLDQNKSMAAIQSSYRSLSENFLPFFQD